MTSEIRFTGVNGVGVVRIDHSPDRVFLEVEGPCESRAIIILGPETTRELAEVLRHQAAYADHDDPPTRRLERSG